jgi:UDP-glucuronate 4-epimerase
MATTAPRNVLITGTAGFIGFHLARRLLANGDRVTGIDGVTPYYDVTLKHHRHAMLRESNHFTAHEFMLEDMERLQAVTEAFKPDIVVHLAAQAGVRYSLENPRAYVDSNLVGTFNVMEAVRLVRPAHFLLASTSSVYGANVEHPFSENHKADHPLTLYAATKKATEVMAHSYAHLWGLPTTVFRFFTVYGPWGRPDMAFFKFVDAMLNDRPIDVYGHGRMTRDFTYIDDLVEGIVGLMRCPPALADAEPIAADSLSPVAPHRVVNIGSGAPTELMTFIETIERALDVTARKNFLPMQKGDVPLTSAATDLLQNLTGSVPTTNIETGVRAFVEWYRGYYRV